ncbi:Lrp/AsnC ligand binding domain-containing protein [Amycolatopsis sp. A133]|uniref:Lrp/AsnC ligand binding domain-containing protein n=1 Tax=Amycolatopsis sp. A133 TaxID=3064472 RepID=UPI0027E62C40|nr:Lrp/AsnC ligand binding domain-containing protein [Amycolatopsis sp. A133]MDQ7808175.1 Lrp/AsnC ligand binding domain-containing protein [Amycolatopsis sp. A133]
MRPRRGGGDRRGPGPPGRHAVGEPDVGRHGDRVFHPGAAARGDGRPAPRPVAADAAGGVDDGVPAAAQIRGRPGGVAGPVERVVAGGDRRVAPPAFGGFVPTGAGRRGAHGRPGPRRPSRHIDIVGGLRSVGVDGPPPSGGAAGIGSAVFRRGGGRGPAGLPADGDAVADGGPIGLESAGRALASHPQVAFAAATTGPANLVANVGCRDDAALYEYLAVDLGGLPGVQRVETAPMIRTLKRFGTLEPV